jgi:hypothetical protein
MKRPKPKWPFKPITKPLNNRKFTLWQYNIVNEVYNAATVEISTHINISFTIRDNIMDNISNIIYETI